MQIVNIEQGTDGWFSLREKRMTASHADAIAACGKGLVTYIEGKMEALYMVEEGTKYQGKAMERGKELEDSAGFLYSMETEEITEKVGFVIYSDFVGCSPDLLVGRKGMAEIKCPENKAFFKLMRGGKVDTGYVWQMQMQMFICEREWCDFVAYNPNPRNNDPLIIQRFNADPVAFRKLEAGFIKGVELMKEIENELGEL